MAERKADFSEKIDPTTESEHRKAVIETERSEAPAPPSPGPPRLNVLVVLAAGLVFYYLLVWTLVFFTVLREYPLEQIRSRPAEFRALLDARTRLSEEEFNDRMDAYFDPSTDLSLASRFLYGLVMFSSLAFVFAFIYIYHKPIEQVLAFRRAGKNVPENERQLARRRLFRSSAISAFMPAATGLWLVGFGLLFGMVGFESNAPLQKVLLRTWPLFVLSIALAAIFIYWWQKHRIQNYFIQYILSPEELRETPPASRDLSLKVRLAMASFITTFLPLGIVFLFLLSSLSTVQVTEWFPEKPSLAQERASEILLGDFYTTARDLDLLPYLRDFMDRHRLFIPWLVHINAMDTPLLLLGLAAGTFIALFYSFYLLRLILASIMRPIAELQGRMLQTADGNYEAFVPVRSNDELGDLSAGFNRMVTELSDRERIRSLFGQYLTREVSDQILSGRVNLNGDLYQAAIMFADIRNFTAMSASMSPADVLLFLNSYLRDMIDVIATSGGIIDKFIGDGILAVFGAPVRSTNYCDQALEAALQMQAAVNRLNIERRSGGKRQPIAIGIGVHAGPIIAGNIGNDRKREYTVIGDTVNLASRIEGLTKRYKSSILVSETVFSALSPQMRVTVQAHEIRGVRVRGKQEPIGLFRIETLPDREL
ncbi:MAG: HAMP domain-containing protein [Spirochaetales bacterium]|nr:HAMP domain-containing protein [Spirochaetales bacterium]